MGKPSVVVCQVDYFAAGFESRSIGSGVAFVTCLALAGSGVAFMVGFCTRSIAVSSSVKVV